MRITLIRAGLILGVLAWLPYSWAIELGREADSLAATPSLRSSFLEISQVIQQYQEPALEDLVAECRAIIVARDDGCRLGPRPCPDIRMYESIDEERRDFLICGAAVRQMGQSGEREWLSVLYDFCPRFGRLVPREIEDRERPVHLPWECRDAIIALEFGELTTLELLNEWREHVVWLMEGGSRTHGDWRRMAIGTAFDRLTTFRGNQRPEVFDIFMTFLEDPDPRVRRLAASRFIEESNNLEMAISAALRFMARSDVDEEARELAMQGIRKRGYEPVSGPRGLMAIPTLVEGSVIEMEPSVNH